VSKTVVLDAGHFGKRNQSPLVSGYYESERMWMLMRYLQTFLELKGIKVICTRAKQTDDLAVTQRGKLAKGSDLFISLHSNAADDSVTDRVVVYEKLNADTRAHSLAVSLAETVSGIINTKQAYAVKTRANSAGNEYYGVMRGAASTDCPYYYILEHSFHTNRDSALFLLEDENLLALAAAEANNISSFLESDTMTLVQRYQSAANVDGWKPELDVDGDIDEKTREAMSDAQKYNSKGERVKLLQELVGTKADGIFGNLTKSAVKTYQKKEGLKADGIAGLLTWSALLA